jgi:hypothetical protein
VWSGRGDCCVIDAGDFMARFGEEVVVFLAVESGRGGRADVVKR